MPSALVWAAAAAGLGAAAAWRRRRARSGGVDLHFDDGSSVSFRVGSDEAQVLLPLARDVLEAARA